MKAPKFSYVRADSLEQVLELLAEHGEDARILAGGQSLMPTLNMRLSQPRLLIDINRLRDLSGIALQRRTACASAPCPAMRTSPVPRPSREHLPLIAEAMPHVAHVAVRNRGTFGGSIALADPAAEMPACALALGATLVLHSTAGRREVAATDYFQGLYQTARRPDELLVEALIPVQRPASVSVFRELAQRHGDFAIAGVAFHLQVDRQTVTDARLVYFGSEDKPTLAQGAAQPIIGHSTRRCSSDCGGGVGPRARPLADGEPACQQPYAPASAAGPDPSSAGHGSRASEGRMSEETAQISLTVNGEAVTRTVPVRQHLVDFLRTDLGLTGSHLGCEHGVCGACSVRVDGRVVRGCLMLAVQADGAEVVTIEGLTDTGEIADLQAAFVITQRPAVRLLYARHADDGGRAAGGAEPRRAARKSAPSCPAISAAAPASRPSSMPSRRR